MNDSVRSHCSLVKTIDSSLILVHPTPITNRPVRFSQKSIINIGDNELVEGIVIPPTIIKTIIFLAGKRQQFLSPSSNCWRAQAKGWGNWESRELVYIQWRDLKAFQAIDLITVPSHPSGFPHLDRKNGLTNPKCEVSSRRRKKDKRPTIIMRSFIDNFPLFCLTCVCHEQLSYV